MRFSLLGLILLSVLLSSCSQIILKFGMTSASVRAALASPAGLEQVLGIATSPLIWLGLVCFGLSAMVWLLVLAQVQLSVAYPFVALGIAITTSGGFFLFGEAMPLLKLVGIGLIISGVLTVATASP